MGANLADYSLLGFDLDNTLAPYNLTSFYRLQYRHLREGMVRRGYPEEAFPEEMTPDGVDFVQRGLFMDLDRGNVVKVTGEGRVWRASHGTRRMSEEEVEASYGEDRRWSAPEEWVAGRESGKTVAFLDFTDAPGVLVFALAVDRSAGPPYRVWPDLLDSIVDMYGRVTPGVLDAVRERPGDYLRAPLPGLGARLRDLRAAGKKLVLVTGAEERDASVTARHVLGPDWTGYFDAVNYDAGKPGFFGRGRPQVVLGAGRYRQGSWGELRRAVGSPEGRALYVGDNLVQDVAGAAEGLALVEELAAEAGDHPHTAELASAAWGPYLRLPSGDLTFWGRFARDRATAGVVASLPQLFPP